MTLFTWVSNVIRKILFFPKAAYASWAIGSAFDKAAAGKEQEAEAVLNAAKNCVGRLIPEGRLLEVYLFYRLARYDEALAMAEEFKSSMESFESKVLNEDEVRYLIGYSNLIRYSARLRKREVFGDLPKVTRNQVDLSKVKSALKRKFPLVNHVDWGLSKESSAD